MVHGNAYNKLFYFQWRTFHGMQQTATGTRVVLSYARIFMHFLEKRIFTVSHLKPTMWLGFIDDIVIIWPHGDDKLTHLMTIINYFYPTINFTYEFNRNRIPILGTLVCRDIDKNLYSKLYKKPTDKKENYPTFHLTHLRKQKEIVHFGLLIRCRRIYSKLEELETKIIINKIKQIPKGPTRKSIHQGHKHEQIWLIKKVQKKEESKIKLITFYNPRIPDMRSILKKNEKEVWKYTNPD